jgi:hypothetical protein
LSGHLTLTELVLTFAVGLGVGRWLGGPVGMWVGGAAVALLWGRAIWAASRVPNEESQRPEREV